MMAKAGLKKKALASLMKDKPSFSISVKKSGMHKGMMGEEDPMAKMKKEMMMADGQEGQETEIEIEAGGEDEDQDKRTDLTQMMLTPEEVKLLKRMRGEGSDGMMA